MNSERLDSMWSEPASERLARERRTAVVGRTVIPICAASALAKAALIVAMALQEPAIYYVAELRDLIVTSCIPGGAHDATIVLP